MNVCKFFPVLLKMEVNIDIVQGIVFKLEIPASWRDTNAGVSTHVWVGLKATPGLPCTILQP